MVRPAGRLEAVDAVRGAAVIFMLAWHTADAWLGSPARDASAFRAVEVVGGLAAPLFFLLAGLGTGIAERLPASAASAAAGLRRALRIVVAGYGLRVFAWGVDHSALLRADAALLVLASAGGLGALYASLGDGGPSVRARAVAGAAGLSLVTLSARWMSERDAAIALRLDVLQGIGAALVVVVLVLWASARAVGPVRILVPALAALAVALAAPHVPGLAPPPGPVRLWDYVARFDVAPAASGARFPLLPWLGYALLGAAAGRALRGRVPEAGPFSLPVRARASRVLALSALVTVLVFEAGPVARVVLAHADGLRNVSRLAYNAGVAVSTAALVAALAPRGGRAPEALALLGRHSLVIYAVHLEIAYGLPGSVIARTLGWASWALLAALLLLGMGALARIVERIERRRPRDHERSATPARARA